jgi:hypothetical protein
MSRPGNVEYDYVRPDLISPKLNVALNNLVAESLKADNSTRSEEEIRRAVLTSHANRNNPNVSVGKGFRTNQSFTRPRSVIYMKDGAPHGMVQFADNASSRQREPTLKNKLRAAFERQAKLHVDSSLMDRLLGIEPDDSLMHHRVRYIGLVSVSESLREEIEENLPRNIATPLDAIVAKGLYIGDRRQKVATYPHVTEDMWRLEAASIGLSEQRDSSRNSFIFMTEEEKTQAIHEEALHVAISTATAPVGLTAFMADSAADVMIAMERKAGMDGYLMDARVHLDQWK